MLSRISFVNLLVEFKRHVLPAIGVKYDHVVSAGTAATTRLFDGQSGIDSKAVLLQNSDSCLAIRFTVDQKHFSLLWRWVEIPATLAFFRYRLHLADMSL